MRIIVKPEEFRFPIPILFPSALIFNHLTAVIVLLVMLAMELIGHAPWKNIPYCAKRLTAVRIFFMYSKFIFVYWSCRIANPGWKLVEVTSKGARVRVKL